MKFKPYQIFLICAAAVVITLCVVYKDRIQGFQTSVARPCAQRSTVNFCLGVKNDPYTCGWCSSSSKCVDAKYDNTGRIVPDPATSTCSDSYNAFHNSNTNTNYNYTSPILSASNTSNIGGSMPVYQTNCSSITDIDTCNSRSTCSWCGDDSKCVRVTIDGNFLTSRGACSDDATLSNYRIPFRDNDNGEWVVSSGLSGMPWTTISEDDISWRSNSGSSGSSGVSGSSDADSEPASVGDITAGSAYAKIVHTVLKQSGLFQTMIDQFEEGCDEA